MENEINGENKNISEVSSISENSGSIPNKNNKLLLLFVTSLLGIFVIVLISYVFEQQSNRTQRPEMVNSTSNFPSTKPSVVPSTEYRRNMPIYSKNGECPVQFKLPPKPEDLDEFGSYWDTSSGGSYPQLLTKLDLENGEYQQSSAIYSSHNPGSGSGYIAQAVIVSCIPNDNRFADNTHLLASLERELSEYNISEDWKGNLPSTIIIESKTPTERWNNSVVDLIANQDNIKLSYTMFVTPQYIYEVRILGDSQEPALRVSAQQIFENLRF